MATIEELLGLSSKGWNEIALMSDEKLAEYLKDITSLEHNSKIVNVVTSSDNNESNDIDNNNDDKLNDDLDLEMENKKEINPFTKEKNKKKNKKKKLLSTYNIDLEVEQLRKELEDL